MSIVFKEAGASSNRFIAADMPLDAQRYPIRELLESFRGAHQQCPDLRLALTGCRNSTDDFSVWNYLDEHGLVDSVDFLPHYGHWVEFPVKKQDCAIWVPRDIAAGDLTAEALLRSLDAGNGGSTKMVLFVTSFHPGKPEGNSALMRQWLAHLRAAGYRIHIVYYRLDHASVSDEIRRTLWHTCDLSVEVDVTTRLVNSNRNGLNVQVDDWCGIELLEAIEKLVGEFEYDVAVVNYAFMSAAFNRIAGYTRKILLAHDSFADRNRRMLEQGFPEAGWVSLDRRGEAVAFRRADVVVALQDEEADSFRALAGPGTEVLVVGPIPSTPRAWPPQPATKLRIGYVGSSNWVNEYNLVTYLTEWSKDPGLVAYSEVLLAGGVCETLQRFSPPGLVEKVQPRLLGVIDPLCGLFEQCDVFINPERGGSGIKIKTLEAMAHGTAVLTTAAGAVGIGSASRFHAAQDVVALARLTAELAADRSLIEVVRCETRNTYAAYLARHGEALTDLLGPPIRTLPAQARTANSKEFFVPDYVRRTASPYHLDEFRKVFSRFDLHGLRVLEIGSDFHLASARLFATNGAAEVVANNLWDWRSPEPLPPNVSYRAGDFSDIDLPERSFDIVYGVAILEHIPDIDRVARAVKRMLRPGGVAYLQGCPVWTGALGHHVYLDTRQTQGSDELSWEAGEPWSNTVYSFMDPAKNPIPNWAHLTHEPGELRSMLVDKGIPPAHAERIVGYVFNTDGKMIGACSNFKTPSEILAGFREHFTVECEPIVYAEPDNPNFQKALEWYSESDLVTLGLQLWLTDKDRRAGLVSTQAPLVSIIVPFYQVEEYIDECLKSVLAQDLPDFELILVDDRSQDGSRVIAERFAAADPRIRIVAHSENRGLGPARNTGVRRAIGTYLLFLDSDDLLNGPCALRTLVEAAEQTGCRVVVGSCAHLKPDGTVAEWDRFYDRQNDGKPCTVVDGLDAFLGGFGMPGRGNLPIRAWGTLIRRSYYEELGLDYPPGEHEDMPHVPFLYYRAGGVYYEPNVVVLYRERPGSLSRTMWSADKLRRYGRLWQSMKQRMQAHQLHSQIGDVAASFACHLMWKIDNAECEADASDAAAEAMCEILADLGNATSRKLLFTILDGLPREPWNSTRDLARHAAMMAGMPDWAPLEFHCSRLGVSLAPVASVAPEPSAAVPASLISAPVASSSESMSLRNADFTEATPPSAEPTSFATQAPQSTSAFEENAAFEAQIMADYETAVSTRLKNFPSMLTLGDKALYFHAARNFSFEGSIVDGGCFVGGTTLSLVEGLQHNPRVRAEGTNVRGLIRVYDLFTIDDDYILRHLHDNYPGQEFSPQTSFLPVFEDNLRAEREMLQVRAGDVTRIGYHDAEPIALFGVDFCKALPITDFTVRTFFPRLMTGALVLQQDFVHEYHPHIHLSMLRLADHFETYVELKWGGTFAYKCVKPISPVVVRERFGQDTSWFADAATNVPLLRRLIEECYYDENRWVFLLTLGMYHKALGHAADARKAYREALDRFPQFVPSDLTRQLIGE